MHNFRALIFDMDGVVVDSNPMHRESWLAYNRSQGLETTEAMQRFMYGKRNDQIVRDFYGPHLTEEEVFAHGAAKEALYREMMRPGLAQALVPGIREFLERHQDVPIGLATNAEPNNALFTLEEAGLAHLFHAVVNGHEVQRPKPDPEIYLKVAGLLETPPAQCVVFEDSYSGAEAARAAGMTVIGLRTTHAEIPGTAFMIDNFLDPALERFL